MPNRLILIHTTVPDKPTAQKLAHILLTQKLAACIHITGPIESHYTWQNELETTQEYTLTIKTQEHLYSKTEKAITTHHPYTLPEITATAITHTSPHYQHWINTNTL